jgi:hypothetical protein
MKSQNGQQHRDQRSRPSRDKSFFLNRGQSEINAEVAAEVSTKFFKSKVLEV